MIEPREDAEMIGHKKLAVVHIIKKELNLSDDEYRDILFKATGVQSAKELDEAKFRKLMRYFVRSRYYRLNDGGLTIRQKFYIQYLVQQLDWTEEHLANFIRKYYHKESLEQLSKEDAIKMVESLKNIRKHSI